MATLTDFNSHGKAAISAQIISALNLHLSSRKRHFNVINLNTMSASASWPFNSAPVAIFGFHTSVAGERSDAISLLIFAYCHDKSASYDDAHKAFYGHRRSCRWGLLRINKTLSPMKQLYKFIPLIITNQCPKRSNRAHMTTITLALSDLAFFVPMTMPPPVPARFHEISRPACFSIKCRDHAAQLCR